MIHFDLDSLIDNLSGQYHEYCRRIRDSRADNEVIIGYVSVDDAMYAPFVDNDENCYYIFTVFKYDQSSGDKRHQYSVRLFGADDGVYCRELKTLDEFYQWIKLFEFRDFGPDDVKQYIDDFY